MITLNVNGESTPIDTGPSTPILWALRDNLGLTGAKSSCGMVFRLPLAVIARAAA